MKIILIILSSLFLMGYKKNNHFLKYTNTDSIKVICWGDFDMGINTDLILGDTVAFYKFKKFIKSIKNSYSYVTINSKNCQFTLRFNYNQELFEIICNDLPNLKSSKKSPYLPICKTQNFNFRIGDSLSWCKNKLKDKDFRFEVDIKDLSKSYLSTQGKIIPSEFCNNKKEIPKDIRMIEYQCNYFFYKDKLKGFRFFLLF